MLQEEPKEEQQEQQEEENLENHQEQEETNQEEQTQEESQEQEAQEEEKQTTPEYVKEMMEELKSLRAQVQSKSNQEDQTQEKSEQPLHEKYSWKQIDELWERADSGELTESQKRELRQLERDKIRAEQRNEFQTTNQVNSKVNGWAGKASEAWSVAVKEMPELDDKESPLFKKARDLFMQDPASKVFTVKDLKDLEKFDLDLVDPRLQLRYAREAKRILDSTKKVSGKKAAKSALSSSTMEQARENNLEKLEKEAVDSGDPRVWQRYFKEKSKLEKQNSTS
jgi:hypothetical protein